MGEKMTPEEIEILVTEVLAQLDAPVAKQMERLVTTLEAWRDSLQRRAQLLSTGPTETKDTIP
jgi:hypothetical protein